MPQNLRLSFSHRRHLNRIPIAIQVARIRRTVANRGHNKDHDRHHARVEPGVVNSLRAVHVLRLDKKLDGQDLGRPHVEAEVGTDQ